VRMGDPNDPDIWYIVTGPDGVKHLVSPSDPDGVN
jgi:hypothetical protein